MILQQGGARSYRCTSLAAPETPATAVIEEIPDKAAGEDSKPYLDHMPLLKLVKNLKLLSPALAAGVVMTADC